MEPFYEHIKKNILHYNGSKRVFHGRGKAFPNFDFFNIDYYSPYILLIFYKEPTQNLLSDIQNFLINLKEIAPIQGIIYQKRFLPKAPSEVLYGEIPEEFNCQLNGLKFNLKFKSSQNIGLFLDFEKGREYIQLNAANKNVLNLFSYTCALSVFAMNAGANKVVNMDMSKMAMKRGYENHQLNNIDIRKVKFFDHDIFKSFGKIQKDGPYDLVIIDPPSDHGDHFKIERDYPKLIKRVEEWLTLNGEAMICLNSPHHSFEFLKNLVLENSTRLEFKEALGFPDYFLEQNPDSGLKITIWKRKEV